MSMVIRPAVVDDAPALAALAEATFVLACPAGTTEEELETHLALHLAVDSFERYLADLRHHLLVAELDGTGGGRRWARVCSATPCSSTGRTRAPSPRS
ncbi:hypothetical protein [Arenivirga flava]|uniref:Uncharacterized protein n=1 Tax=Arenivirga flava TaxID=1930060 RepID=A0AA37UFD6_9MICO|nr:hypothetical protein GCM10025874_25120 [Arenivirga flava]